MDLSSLKERIKDAKQRIEQISSEEEDISNEEDRESAEIQKLKKLSERLRSSGSKGDILEEEIADFEEAVRLIKEISVGLEQTADDLHRAVAEIDQTSEQLVGVLSRLEDGETSIEYQETEYLRDSLNANHKTVEYVIREAGEAKREAKGLRDEIDSLIELDRFIEEMDGGGHDLSDTERTLQDVKNRADSTVQKLGRIESEVEDAEKRDKQAFDKISRREAISRGAATVAALTTLPGVKASEQEVDNGQESSLDKKLKEITLRTGEAVELETGETVELEQIREREALLEINGQLATPEQGQVLQLENTRIKVDTVFKGSNLGVAVINVGDIAAETVKTLDGGKKSPEENRSEITVEKGETIALSNSKKLNLPGVRSDTALLRIIDGDTLKESTSVSPGEKIQLENQTILLKSTFIGADTELAIIQIR